MLDEIERYKLPALRQSGLKVAARPAILLFSRSGFKQALVEAASDREDLQLISASQVVDGLLDRDA